jgi:hypothetical protein
MLIYNKQTTDTAADTRQPAMERKAGQMEEASWENHKEEARTLLAEAKYFPPFLNCKNHGINLLDLRKRHITTCYDQANHRGVSLRLLPGVTTKLTITATNPTRIAISR